MQKNATMSIDGGLQLLENSSDHYWPLGQLSSESHRQSGCQ